MLPDQNDYDEISTDKKTGSQGSQPSRARSPEDTAGSQDADCDPEKPEKESILAKKIAGTFKDSLLYDEVDGEWYSPKNNFLWEVTSEKKALKMIMRPLDEKLPDGYALCKLNNVKAFLSIYCLLDEWTASPHLLPMKNGVLDTRSMTLIKYQPTHRFNWQLPYCYDANAKIDVIRHWLWLASGHDLEAVNIIRAFFKMALIGGDVQKFLELIGPGGTGKSTLIRLLVAFIGKKNHTVTDLKNLETNNFEAASLYGKRLAIINDSSRYGGEVSMLKAITGGDPIRLEKKNKQQSGSFEFDGVVVIASNEPIQSADYTSGLIRRRMPVNFNYKVSDADKARWKAAGGIEKAMHSELAGLLNWVMAMTPEEVNQAIGGLNADLTQVQREHLIATNKIAHWIDSNLIISPDIVAYVGNSMKEKKDRDEITSAIQEKLYANYESFCDDNRVNPVALQRFTNSIIDVCQQTKINVIALDKDRKGRPVKGLKIRTDCHFNYATPITKKLLCDPEKALCDPVVTQQSRSGDDGDPCDPINSDVKKESAFNDDTEIF